MGLVVEALESFEQEPDACDDQDDDEQRGQQPEQRVVR